MILLTLGLLSVFMFVGLKCIYTHWQRKGMPYIKPSIPTGNLGLVVKKKASFPVAMSELHKSSTDPFVGIYLLYRPALLIRDAELVQRIMTTDFNYFHDRGLYCNPKNDPLTENLFAMTGKCWKGMREKMMPTFTAGHMNNFLMPTIMIEGDKLVDHTHELFDGETETLVDLKDLLAKYTINVIASALFGVEVDIFKHPDHEFRIRAEQVDSKSLRRSFHSLGAFLFPGFLETLKSNTIQPEVETYFIGIVKETIEHRQKNNIRRNDYLQCLIDLRNDQGMINETEQSISLASCAAQLFIFYIGGNDTTSSISAFCLYELSRKPEILAKVQNEIDTIMAKHNNQLTPECIQEMKYLDLCIKETFRKYPFPMINRICTTDYNIPNTNYIVEKGTAIVISTLGIHRDARYYPDPEEFMPERFAEETKNYNSSAYIPFGQGPRYCIGMHFGKIAVQIAVVRLLKNFSFKAVNDKDIEFASSSIPLVPKDGLKVFALKR